MKTTIKPSGILADSGHIFKSYHVEMVDEIYQLLKEKNFKELGRLVNTIKTRGDYEYIHIG